MSEMSPCKGCTKRHPACHDSCDVYKEWRERHQAQQKYLEKNKHRFDAPWSASRERKYRKYTKLGSSNFKQGGSQ